MESVVTIAVIVAAGSVTCAATAALSPIILARLNAEQRREERAEDRADRLEVANKVDQAARAVDQVAKVAAESTAETHSQLKQIHTLVNSDMTAARQAELDQTVASVVLMKELIALKQMAGHEPSSEVLAALKSNEERVTELRLILADRMEQMKSVEAEILAAQKAK